MNLSNLKRLKDLTKTRKNRRGPGSGLGELQQEVIKVPSLDSIQEQDWFEGGQMPIQRRLPQIRFQEY